MKRILTFSAGRRAKWVVLAVWLLAVMGTGASGLQSKFESGQKNESTSFLPASTESTKEQEAEGAGGEQRR